VLPKTIDEFGALGTSARIRLLREFDLVGARNVDAAKNTLINEATRPNESS
jgi:hypothetical protein